MNFEHLKTQSPEELRVLAGKMGLHVHHKAGVDKIVKQIMEAALLPQVNNTADKPDNMKHVAEKPVAPVDHNTPETIMAAIADIVKRQPKFEATFNEDENTWHFKCLGAEDCGNMSIPIRVIKMKANTVSRGRLAMMSMNNHFDSLPVSGNSAYTNTVLA